MRLDQIVPANAGALPLPGGERVAVRGDGPSIFLSPLTRFAAQIDLSPQGLASAHVCFEEIALGDGINMLQSVAHSDRSRGSLAFVAGPSADASNRPVEPGK